MLQFVLHQIFHGCLRQTNRLTDDTDTLTAATTIAAIGACVHLVSVDARLTKLLLTYVASFLAKINDRYEKLI